MSSKSEVSPGRESDSISPIATKVLEFVVNWCVLFVFATKIVDSIIEYYALDVVTVAAVLEVRMPWVRLEKVLLSPLDMDPPVVPLTMDIVEFLFDSHTFVIEYDVNVEDLS